MAVAMPMAETLQPKPFNFFWVGGVGASAREDMWGHSSSRIPCSVLTTSRLLKLF